LLPALKQNLGSHRFKDNCEVARVDIMSGNTGHGLLQQGAEKLVHVINLPPVVGSMCKRNGIAAKLNLNCSYYRRKLRTKNICNVILFSD
jgi:hypothetical protein